MPYASAYDQGYSAYLLDPTSTNPYSWPAVAWSAWNWGFMDAAKLNPKE